MKVLHIYPESLRVVRELDITDDSSILDLQSYLIWTHEHLNTSPAWKAASIGSRVIARPGSVSVCSKKMDMTSVSRDVSHLK